MGPGMVAPKGSRGPRSGQDNEAPINPGKWSRARAWGKRLREHLLETAVSALVFALLAILAAISSPLDSSPGVLALFLAFGVLIHVSLGAVVADVKFEAQKENGSSWAKARQVVRNMSIEIAIPVIPLTALFWIFVVEASTSGAQLAAVVIVAVLSLSGAARYWWDKEPPGHKEPPPKSSLFQLEPASALVGAVLGTGLAVVMLWVSAIINTDAQGVAPAVVNLRDFGALKASGYYVSLGDSYSAGQGLYTQDPYSNSPQNCDRSAEAYGPLLAHDEGWDHLYFEACSGAVIKDIFTPTTDGQYSPQVKGLQYAKVRLVTITIGGNDALFSTVVEDCIEHPSCMQEDFPPPGVAEVDPVNGGEPEPLQHKWAVQTVIAIGEALGGDGRSQPGLFNELRDRFKNARVVVIGYPDLFPQGRAPLLTVNLMCASILRRVDERDRGDFFVLQQQFNNVVYEEAAKAGIEYISPDILWEGHAPCGAKGQWTNSIEAYWSVQGPIGSGSFHPTATGQKALAALISCYLMKHPGPPRKYAITVPTTKLVPPAAFELRGGGHLPPPWGDAKQDFAGCGPGFPGNQ